MTTLSTVGYGDFYPVSSRERIIVLFIMFGGVIFFSYIMSNFIEILSSFEKRLGNVDRSSELGVFLEKLSRFNNNQTLPKTLIT